MRNIRTRAIIVAVLVSIVSPVMSSKKRETVGRQLLANTSLVAPGLGAEGVMLGEDVDQVLRRHGREGFRMSRPPAFRGLFKDVFNIDSGAEIVFDSLYLSEEKRMTLCVLHGRIAAVIGLNGDRITVEGVDLKKGINHFVYHYGNRDLVQLLSRSNGIFLYPRLGIGAVDDGLNDSVDLYLVFPPNEHNDVTLSQNRR